MESFILLFILLLILFTIVSYKKENYQNDKELYYNEKLTKNDIQNYDTLIVETKYLTYKNDKLMKFIEENYLYFNKLVLIYTEKFNKTDILSKINDNSELDFKINEENLSYYNVYFRKK
tara:strand:- start:139 stop:495 length:357 start_codon:yes stop_codon:yes gene_type:complete